MHQEIDHQELEPIINNEIATTKSSSSSSINSNTDEKKKPSSSTSFTSIIIIFALLLVATLITFGKNYRKPDADITSILSRGSNDDSPNTNKEGSEKRDTEQDDDDNRAYNNFNGSSKIEQQKEQSTCSNSLLSGLDFVRRLHQNLQFSSPTTSSLESTSYCSKSKQSNLPAECANSWLEKCWMKNQEFLTPIAENDDSITSNVHLKRISACQPLAMKQFVTETLNVPRKHWVWRENASEFVREVQAILRRDDLIVKADCKELQMMSTFICQNIPLRPLKAGFMRGGRGAVATAPSSLRKVRLSDQFGLNYKFNVLEALEFQTSSLPLDDEEVTTNKTPTVTTTKVPPLSSPPTINTVNTRQRSNRSRRRKSAARITKIDLICSGMFHQNAEVAESLWKNAEEKYYSAFEFRHRHFFQWNTVRDARVRLVKAKRLYNKDLEERMNTLRNIVGKNNFETWITLDIDSPPVRTKENIIELFSQVLLLRFIAARYLLSTSKRKGNPRLADFFVWVRPDLGIHPNHLAHILRLPPSQGDGIKIAIKQNTGRKHKSRIYVLRADSETEEKQLLAASPNTTIDPNRMNILLMQAAPGTATHSKVTDFFLVGNASSLMHIYTFLPSVMHSCVYYPYPSNFFIELYMKIGATDYYHTKAEHLQWGVYIDRSAGKN